MASRLTVPGYVNKVRRYFEKHPTAQIAVFTTAFGDLAFTRLEHVPELVAVYRHDVPTDYLEEDAYDIGLRQPA